MLRLTRSRLSDGREILYFDTPDSPPRTATDERALPGVHTESTMRRDPLTGQWTLFAAHRQHRTFLPPAHEDPLAPTLPGGYPSEIPEADYQVVVFENRFPSLTLHGSQRGDGTAHPALGRCEVVCFTPEPQGSFADLPLERKRALIEVWAHRTEELSRIEGIRAVFPFENRGEEIGVTLSHPHGQIYSYPFVPPRMAAIAEQVRGKANLFDEVIEAELRARDRVILSTPGFLVYTPVAAKWPVEIMVMPRRPVPDFPALSAAEREELAGILHGLFPAVDRFFEGVERTPYIAAWNQAPVGQPEAGRLHLQLFSLMRSPHRMKYLAGSESGMGAWINDTTPEVIAERMRQVWR
ncbi:galactose-1-phosphate uridylyltransferase [Corynebacterium oculi]|uniref:Galactose-1-phosphate uridylyltransferase n=1 Tax=Corynebacterium oculi TaxID=1544416 RepID=A0A0N8VZH8_9CORY|nr:galactose-1-phosphate uridylyltransferase [Corynebacterium oculi]KQB83938.1 Galactose-1-phosphate uridylyltransferase [Corynebacterium oculi]